MRIALEAFREKRIDGKSWVLQLLRADAPGGIYFAGWVGEGWMTWDKFGEVTFDPQVPVFRFLETGEAAKGDLDLLFEAVGATANPQEIAILARNLEAAAPEQYRDAAVAAARGALARAGLNPAAVDTSPLFEVFQKFGGATAVSDLELAAKKWNYYAPLALASLPDGVGVGSLARMAQNADGTSGNSSRFALQMLAQLAPQYPDAAKALLDQISAGRVPDSAWYGIASALSGTQTYYGNGYLTTAKPVGSAEEPKSYSIPSNQQTYRSWNVAGNWTPVQVQQQLALVDQMRAVNPVAARMLEGVRGTLAAPRPGP